MLACPPFRDHTYACTAGCLVLVGGGSVVETSFVARVRMEHHVPDSHTMAHFLYIS